MILKIFLSFQALDGFIAVITQDGQLFYVSENVRDFLGYSQVSDIFQYPIFFPVPAQVVIFLLVFSLHNRGIQKKGFFLLLYGYGTFSVVNSFFKR